MENEAVNGGAAYNIKQMMDDLTQGIWSDARGGKAVDTYRRNLQRAHVDRLIYLLQDKPAAPSGRGAGNAVDPDVTDIRAAALDQLTKLAKTTKSGSSEALTKIHLAELNARIKKAIQ